MKKKVLSLFLALCLLAGMLPLAASAAEEGPEEGGPKLVSVDYYPSKFTANEETNHPLDDLKDYTMGVKLSGKPDDTVKNLWFEIENPDGVVYGIQGDLPEEGETENYGGVFSFANDAQFEQWPENVTPGEPKEGTYTVRAYTTTVQNITEENRPDEKDLVLFGEQTVEVKNFPEIASVEYYLSKKAAAAGAELSDAEPYTMSVVFDQFLPSEYYESVWFVIEGPDGKEYGIAGDTRKVENTGITRHSWSFKNQGQFEAWDESATPGMPADGTYTVTAYASKDKITSGDVPTDEEVLKMPVIGSQTVTVNNKPAVADSGYFDTAEGAEASGKFNFDCADHTMYVQFDQPTPEDKSLWFEFSLEGSPEETYGLWGKGGSDTHAWSFDTPGQIDKWPDDISDWSGVKTGNYTVNVYYWGDGDPEGENVTEKPENVGEPFATTEIYVVNEKVGDVEIAAGDPEVSVGDGIGQDDRDEVEKALVASKAVSGLTGTERIAKVAEDVAAIVDKDTAKTQLEEAGVTVQDSDSVYIFVQPYLDIEATAYSQDTALTLDITAKYRTVATIKADAGDIELGENNTNAVVLNDSGTSGDLTVDEPVKVAIQLPSGFVTDTNTTAIYVLHKNEHYHKATVTTDNTNYTATFDTEGFSPFVFDKNAAPQASIDGTYYETLQKAVDAVENGKVIEVLEESLTATVSREVAFKTTGKAATITAGAGYKNESTIPGEYNFVREGGTGGGGGGAAEYTVTVTESQNGAVTADLASAGQGTKVTLTVSPAEGYELGTLTVKDASGKAVSTVKVSDAEYTFVMPESNVTVSAAFVEKNATPFTDVKTSDWWYEAVKYVYENKLMAGTSATAFEPTAKLNRAQAVQILYNLEGQPAVTGAADFTDVSGHWALNAISWGAENHIVAGVGNNKFDPNADVTREQFAVMMYNYAKFKGYDLTAQGNLNSFSDVSKVSDWAVTALTWANGEGLINGNEDGTLAPNGTAIRGQAASIMAKFDQNVVK